MRIINTAELTATTLPTYDEQLFVYNGLDVCVTLEIFEEIQKQLDPISQRTYNFSLALQAPILEMNMRGSLVDLEYSGKLIFEFKELQDKVKRNFDRITIEGLGVSINPQSPAALNKLFYEVLELPPVKKRRPDGTFGVTTNREALEKLKIYSIAEPLINHILLYRDLGKKISFLKTEIDPDSRIRTSFNIAGTVTGRLSSSHSDFGSGTNLQNIEKKLRRVIIADPGMKFANIDLEQSDARNVGALLINMFHNDPSRSTNCSAYLDACESGDLHTAVCRMAWPELPWTGDAKSDREVADYLAYRDLSFRDMAKKLGHGTNYYGQPPTMAKHTKVDRAPIELFQKKYFAAFPHIRYWHDETRRQLLTTGTLITPFGRRRRFFGRLDDDSTLREAIAYIPQSMTADEIDEGILRLWRLNKVQLLIQVHDSILFQYPEELEPTIIPIAMQALQIEQTLVNGRKFTVPAEVKTGWNWADFDETNPDGLMKYRGKDVRSRSAPVAFLDRLVY